MKGARSHRLVSRFAVTSLAAFTAIGITLAASVSRQARQREEAAAASHAQFVTQSILRYELTPADLTDPVVGERYDQLHTIVESRILTPTINEGAVAFDVVRVKIWRRDGTVLFSDEPRLVGMRFSIDRDLTEGMAGIPNSEVTDLQEEENQFERDLAPKLFATYVPLYLDPRRTTGPADAVAEMYQDYGGVQTQIDRVFVPVALTLGLGLLALYVALIPIMRRASRRLSEQNKMLTLQADQLSSHLASEQRTVAELRELNRLRSNFVAIASHELRSPLTSIIGSVKTLQRPEMAEQPDVRTELLQATERQADRLLRLVEHLLVTAQIEEHRLRLTLTPLDFARVARESVEDLGHQGHRVLVRIPRGLPPLHSDRHYLGLVLTNLLDNALKFSPNGSSCELSAAREGDHLSFSVTDHGIGIPAEEIDRIFDRFFQMDSSPTRAYGGVGLGLSLVRELTEQIGGSIRVTSEPERGSTFTVTLPLRGPDPAPDGASPDGDGREGGDADGPGLERADEHHVPVG